MIKYKKGDIVKGIVTGIEKYGIFISLDDYNSGLIHISEISENFVKDPNDYVKIGESIQSVVLEDEEEDSYHVKLSIKGIDYRINRNKNKKIKETKHGFDTLNKKLPEWISNKKEELGIVIKN